VRHYDGVIYNTGLFFNYNSSGGGVSKSEGSKNGSSERKHVQQQQNGGFKWHAGLE
jgi:hypothetical protein